MLKACEILLDIINTCHLLHDEAEQYLVTLAEFKLVDHTMARVKRVVTT